VKFIKWKNDELIKVSEAAERLKVCRESVLRYVRQGTLEMVTVSTRKPRANEKPVARITPDDAQLMVTVLSKIQYAPEFRAIVLSKSKQLANLTAQYKRISAKGRAA
jgi:predicted site-specific integrase-resolvase